MGVLKTGSAHNNYEATGALNFEVASQPKYLRVFARYSVGNPACNMAILAQQRKGKPCASPGYAHGLLADYD
jgi:hypothetical protein